MIKSPQNVKQADQANRLLLKSGGICRSGSCRQDFHSECAQAAHEDLLRAGFDSITEDTKTIAKCLVEDKNVPLRGVFEAAQEEEVPSYNIDSWDRFSSSWQLEKVIKNHFFLSDKKELLPIELNTCIRDGVKGCTARHSTAIKAFIIRQCVNSKGRVLKESTTISLYDSSGFNKEYSLKDMVKGMFKHQLGVMRVHPCEEGIDCRHPSLKSHPPGFEILHFASAGDAKNVRRLLDSGDNL